MTNNLLLTLGLTHTLAVLLISLAACTPAASPSATSRELEPTLVTAIPSPASTAKPTVTSTPGGERETPCLVVSTELCQVAEVFEVEVGGRIEKAIGLKLPVHTEIYSFREGTVFYTKLKDPFRGLSILVGDVVPDKSKPSVSLIGDLVNVSRGKTVTAGEIVATTQDTGLLNLNLYNLIVSVNALSTDNPESVLRGLFPEAFSKPARKVRLDQTQNSSPTYSGSQVITD